MAARGVSQDWVVLQRKIFSRWCKQKLIRRHDVKVSDIVEDCKEGVVLYALIEELSESKYPGAVPKQGSVKGRIKQIECINNALKFVWSKGVELKLKPSAEQIADGDEAAVLALVFAIMMKFMKIGDDEESEKLNAKDALLMWCQNKCQGLGDRVPAIESFKKTSKAPFHSGVALCAIIHKHRPALVPLDKQWTVELAQEAALEYFGLEKFVTPAEVAKLDENSMVVYVSEFYYGIMEQRKVDLAARRITKLIKLTIENDRLKAEYNRTAAEYKERLVRVEAVLGDRTIDDTMAGARRRLDEFYKYKTDDKNALLTAQLNLESLFNNLAMRLAHHKRPEFIPPAGVSLKDVEAALLHLEKVEQERSVALHAELNRQVRLVQLNSQHETMFKNFQAWSAEKEAFLRHKEIIESVSAAQLQLRLLEAFDKESAAVRVTNVRALKAIGEELKRERYEGMAGVAEREKAIDEALALLDSLSEAKHPVLQDDLAREQHKERVRLDFRQHTEKNEALCRWIEQSAQYLETRELIVSSAEAHTHLSLLDSWEKEKASMLETAVAELKRLGEDILAAKYKTQYSEWEFEHPEEIRARAANADSEWVRLAELSAEKRRVLMDHLAREELHERTVMTWKQHQDRFAQLERWIAAKEKYLTTWPEVHTVADALAQLGLFSGYEQENTLTRQTQVVELLGLGEKIRAAKHESGYSSYVFEHVITKQPPHETDDPESRRLVDDHEKFVLGKWDELAELAKKFKAVLDDHLQREEYISKARIVGLTHGEKFRELETFVNKTEAYSRAREEVHSVAEAKAATTVLEGIEKDFARTRDIRVVEFRAIGADVLGRSYSTEFSSYKYDESDCKLPAVHFGTPEPRKLVEDHNAWVEAKFKELAELLALKRAVIEDHIAREQYAEETRKLAAQHADQYAKYCEWAAAKEAMLRARETVESIGDVTKQLALLDAFDAEHKVVRGGEVAGLTALGAELLGRERNTNLSTYAYEHTTYKEPSFEENKPELRALIGEHEKFVLDKWEELGKLSAEKKRICLMHQAREQFALHTRTLAQQHNDMHGRMVAWSEEKLAFLRVRETIDSVSLAQTHITLLDQYDAEYASMTATLLKEYNTLGKTILDAVHKDELGSYAFEHTQYSQPEYDHHEPERRAELEAHIAAIAAVWAELAKEAVTRRTLLDDHLAREKFAHEVRLLDSQHDKLYQTFLEWCNRKAEYLKARPAIDSVSDANTQLSVLAAYEKERVTTEQTSVASIAKLGDEILPKRYKTDLSAWEPENPDEIRGRLATAKEELAKLDEMRNALKADLDAALARELEKERLRLEYAHLTLEFIKFAKDAGANLAIESFGFTLEEVQAYKAEITASRTKLLGDADAQIAQIKAVFKQAEDMGVRENVYTTTTLADVDATRAKLVQAIDTRDAAYEKELARQVANDNLCKEFAGLVDPFSKDIIAQKDAISTSKAELDAQLAYVDKQIAEFLPALAKRLEPIRALAKKMEDAGITNIRHTTLTLRDVEAQERQFGKFLQTKREMLAQEIENAKLRGISPEQFREIETMFATFDKDKSGDIDRKELAACLYSLGEERGAKEIAEIMKEYGDGTKITLPRFREFMIHVFGDSETKQEILLGLEMINRHNRVASLKQMQSVQPADDIAYFTKTAPQVEGGWDFVAWVESMYSR